MILKAAAVAATCALAVTGASAAAQTKSPGDPTAASSDEQNAPAPRPDGGKPNAPPPPTPGKPTVNTKGGTPATVVNLKTIEGVMGKSVRSRANEDMGRVVDVLVDGGGQVRAAVIDFGGFLGVGSRKVAVAWKTLDFADSIQSGSVKVTLTRDQVRQSPEYKPDEPIVILEGGALPKPAGATATPGHNQDAPPR